MKNVRIGLIGFGSMGKVHSYCVENLKYFFSELPFSANIAGVCTTSEKKSKAVANTYGFEVGMSDENMLINDSTIDVIDVCTPNIYHYETVKKALLAGKHVYCEKPLCVTYAEAKELSLIAKKSGLICNVVFNNRFISPIIRAKQLIDEGRLGRVLSFSCEYLHNSCIDVNRPAGWKQDASVCGGGVLFDLGSHAIDLIYHLCGEFDSVSGTSQIAYPTRLGIDGNEWSTNADEAFYITAKLTCGAVGTITVSKLTTGSNDDLNLCIYGEKGAIKFSLMQPNFLYFYDATEPSTPIGGNAGYTAIECVGRYPAPAVVPAPKAPSSWIRAHMQSMYEFLSSVSSGVTHSPDFSDGAYVQAVMESAYISARSNSEMRKVEL